jgi:uncharacterized protein YodC (DUF2158 family)
MITECQEVARFCLGQIVMLKSGGPAMKVIGFSPGGRVWCEWEQVDGIKDEASFVPAMLMSSNA